MNTDKRQAAPPADSDSLNDLLYRRYLDRLTDGRVLPALRAAENLTRFLRGDLQLLRIERLVYEKKKEKIEELLNVYSSLTSLGVALIFVVESDGERVELLVGVRRHSDDADIASARTVLQESLRGHFPGTRLSLSKNPSTRRRLEAPAWQEANGIVALTGIPSLKTERGEEFVQGFDRFLDAMRGRKYVCVIIADPVSEARVEESRQGYAHLTTTLSSLAERQLQTQHTKSTANSASRQETWSRAISQMVGQTTTTTTTKTSSKSRPSKWAAGTGAAGALVGAGIGFMVAGPPGAALGAGMGLGLGVSAAGTNTEGENKTNGKTNVEQQTATDTKGGSSGSSETETEGRSWGVSVTIKDRSLQHHVDVIERQMERLQAGSRYGFWNTGVYFLAGRSVDAEIAASVFRGLFRGEDSDLEPSRSMSWRRERHPDFERVLGALTLLEHPAIEPASILEPGVHAAAQIARLHPTSLLSSLELSLIMGLPERSLPGLPVRQAVAFGRQVTTQGDRPLQRPHTIGRIFHMGSEERGRVGIERDSLALHTLICGTTGSGKTNATKVLLTSLSDSGIPFLIVEPVKGEYGDMVQRVTSQPVTLLRVGDPSSPLLRLNPLAFPDGIHVLEHIDRLTQLFSAAFPMYAAMPALLDEGLHRVYEAAGWDLGSGRCASNGFPTLHHLVSLLPEIISSSGYSQQMTADYQGAMVTRFRSLTRGLRGATFCPHPGEETKMEALFDQSCIVDLKAVGSSETRALLMGLLVLRLYEYRQHQPRDSTGLRHVTVLEEAHHLLRRSSTEQNPEDTNPQGLAVEMFSNAIAEMRAFGEGFVVVDQSATSLDLAAIKNTNTKMVLRTPYAADRELVGLAANMDEDQIRELGRLETGVAAIYQNDWLEPVLCRFPLLEPVPPPKPTPSATDTLSVLLTLAIPNLVQGSAEDRRRALEQLPSDALKTSAVKLSPHDPQILEGLLKRLYTPDEVTATYTQLLSLFPQAPQPFANIHAGWAFCAYTIRRLGTTPQFAASKLAAISDWSAEVILERLRPYL